MNKKTKRYIFISVCAVLLGFVIVTNFVKITYIGNEFYNNFISKIIQNLCATALGLLIVKYLNIRLFSRIEKAVYVIPCLVLAVNNLQWVACLSGTMQIVHNGFVDYFLFTCYCLSIGIFEEVFFRGIIFTALLKILPKTRKGLIESCVISSVIFGLAHIFNGFSVDTLLQICYSTLTGCLFAFSFIKTKNIIVPTVLHGIYNFCGTLFSTNGLGGGVAFDLGTIITMASVYFIGAVFILTCFLRIKNQEVWRLNARLTNLDGDTKYYE